MRCALLSSKFKIPCIFSVLWPKFPSFYAVLQMYCILCVYCLVPQGRLRSNNAVCRRGFELNLLMPIEDIHFSAMGDDFWGQLWGRVGVRIERTYASGGGGLQGYPQTELSNLEYIPNSRYLLMPASRLHMAPQWGCQYLSRKIQAILFIYISQVGAL